MLCSSAGLPLTCQLASAASVPFLPAGIEREPHVERMPDKYQNCHIRWRMPASPMSSDRTGTSVAMTPLSRAGLPSEGADMPCNSAELLWTRQSSQLLLSLPSSLRRWIATLMRGGALSSVRTDTSGGECLHHRCQVQKCPFTVQICTHRRYYGQIPPPTPAQPS